MGNDHLTKWLGLIPPILLLLFGLWLCRAFIQKFRSGTMQIGGTHVRHREVSRWDEPKLFWQFVAAWTFFVTFFIVAGIVYLVAIVRMILHAQ